MNDQLRLQPSADISEGDALEWVGRYRSLGWCPIPIPPGSKAPTLTGWPDLRLTEADLPAYFQPDSNVGLLLGRASGGLVDVDLDVPEAVELAQEYLPETGMIHGRAGNPRSHRWYLVEGDCPSRSFRDYNVAKGAEGDTLVEIRGDKHQTCVPPSMHPDGDIYCWDVFGDPTRVTYDDLAKAVRRLAACVLIARHWPDEGSRQDFAMALGGVLARNDWDQDDAAEFIWWAAYAADDEEADKRADTVAGTYQKLDDGDPATGWPSLKAMMPPKVADRLAEWLDLRTAGPLVVVEQRGLVRPEPIGPAANVVPTGPDVIQALRQYGITFGGRAAQIDEGQLRDFWIRDHPLTVRGRGEWRRYQSGVWCQVSAEVVKQEVAELLEAALVPLGRGKIESVTELIGLKVAVPHDRWDANPDILVCRNGVLDLKSGKMRQHDAEDYATTKLPYDYDPAAEAPSWGRCLDRLSEDVASFLQEFAGYSLTTDTRHEIAVWLVGPPGGGKSTFIEGLKVMVGPRYEVLGLANLVSNRYALAKLVGKTLVLATEQPAEYVRTTDILKALISGEDLEAEKKFKDPFTFRPVCKLLWAMNELPRIAGAGDGIFRRIKVVRWPELAERARDENLKDHLHAEGPGILNWALEGQRRLRDRGRFDVPAEVQEAVAEYQKANDIPAQFVEERCDTGPGHEVQADGLYSAYRDWCLDNGYKPASKAKVAEDWKRLGFERKHTKRANFWQGVGLKTWDPWPPD